MRIEVGSDQSRFQGLFAVAVGVRLGKDTGSRQCPFTTALHQTVRCNGLREKTSLLRTELTPLTLP